LKKNTRHGALGLGDKRARSVPVAALLIFAVLLSAGSGIYAGASFFPQQAPNVTITTTIYTTTTSWTTSTIWSTLTTVVPAVLTTIEYTTSTSTITLTSSSSSVTATSPYDAAITANDMPTAMVAGQTYTVHITVLNRGSNTWTAADGYKLGAAGDVNPFGPTRVLLGPPDSIATGQSKTFTLTVTAPSAAGTYTVTWRMVRELVTWFGGTSKVTVAVSAAVSNAVIVGNDMPAAMTRGQTYTVHITVQNTGTTTWTAASNYKLGFVGDNPPFGPSRILLDGSASVAPGQQCTFTFTVTAPTTTGTYTMRYRMLQELVAWFGQTSTTSVTVQ